MSASDDQSTRLSKEGKKRNASASLFSVRLSRRALASLRRSGKGAISSVVAARGKNHRLCPEREKKTRKRKRKESVGRRREKSIGGRKDPPFPLSKRFAPSPCQRRHDLVGLARAVVHHQVTRALERLHESEVREEEDFASDVAGAPAPEGRRRGDHAERRRRREGPAHVAKE